MNQTPINNAISKLQNSESGAKRKYIKPRIELIFLDNEISLALESTPPIGIGDEQAYNAPTYFNSTPNGLDLA